MRTVFTAVLAASMLVCADASVAQDAGAFCDELRSKNIVNRWGPSEALFYRDANGKIVELARTDVVPQQGIEYLYYYLPTGPGPDGRLSALNIKFVYKSAKPPSRQQIVDLRNDRWNNYSYDHQKRIRRDCARVDVDGYDRYHLSNSRSFCLSTHFHQYAPEFETVATPQRRAAFAFADMIGDPAPNLLSSLFGLVTPGPATAAGADQLSTAKLSHVRSWVRNLKLNGDPDHCVAIRPEFPQNVIAAHLRIVYLGTDLNHEPNPRNWNLTFAP